MLSLIFSLLFALTSANIVELDKQNCVLGYTEFYKQQENLGVYLASNNLVWDANTNYSSKYQFPFTPSSFTPNPGAKHVSPDTTGTDCNGKTCSCNIEAISYSQMPLYPGAVVPVYPNCGGNIVYIPILVTSVVPVYVSSYLYSTSDYGYLTEQSVSCTGSCNDGSCLSYSNIHSTPVYTNIQNGWSNGLATCCSTTNDGYRAAAVAPAYDPSIEMHMFSLQLSSVSVYACTFLSGEIHCYDYSIDGQKAKISVNLDIPNTLVVGVITQNYVATGAYLGPSAYVSTQTWGRVYDYIYKGKDPNTCINLSQQYPSGDPILWGKWQSFACQDPTLYVPGKSTMSNFTGPVSGFSTLINSGLVPVQANSYNLRFNKLGYQLVNGVPTLTTGIEYTSSYLEGNVNLNGGVSTTTLSVAEVNSFLGQLTLTQCSGVPGGDISGYCVLTVVWKVLGTSVIFTVGSYDQSSMQFGDMLYMYPGVTSYNLKVLFFSPVTEVSFDLFVSGVKYTSLKTNKVFMSKKSENDTVTFYTDLGTANQQIDGVPNDSMTGVNLTIVIVTSVCFGVLLLCAFTCFGCALYGSNRNKKILSRTGVLDLRDKLKTQ